MEGQKFLKVTSILMIIGGVLGIIGGIVAVMGVFALSVLGGSSSLLTISTVLLIVASIIELIAGARGLGACKDASKAAACVVLGGIIAVLSVISLILGYMNSKTFSIPSLLLNLLIPGLYIYGAIKMKQ